MRANLEKFLFLGVMVGLTFFFNHKTSGNLASLSDSVLKVEGSNEAISNFPKVSELDEGVPLEARPVSTSVTPKSSFGADSLDLVAVSDSSTSSVSSSDIDKDLGLDKPLTDSASDEKDSPGVPVYSSDQAQLIGSVVDVGFSKVGEEKPFLDQVEVALVADLYTGDVYFDLNADKRWPIASITKLMTAASVFSRNNLGALVDGGEFLPGEKYSVLDLTEKMLLPSNNESAEALASFYNRPNFLAAMNEQAKLWGMNDTFFKDPTGISVSNQSTAFDIERMVKQIYDSYPEILKITRRRSADVTEINSGRKSKVLTINDFAGRADFLGGKTGYTDDAGSNLVSLFSYNNRPLLIVVLGTEDRFGQTENLLDWFKRNYK